ncbi:hypothetical protein Tco_0798956 [Tanacetum coccineum]
MVAFLSKPAESEGFEQIVDFLNANPIRYALTINPTIYISCIEQFWSTVKAKTVNGEVQLQALVDGKKIIITESTVRRDLQLEDAEGVDYEAIHKKRGDSLVRAATTASSLEVEQDSGGGPRRQETMGDTTARTRFESVSKLSNDPLLARGNTLQSGEDSLKLNELIELSKVESSGDKESLGEDASKQGRINAIDANEDITLVNNQDDAYMFDVNTLTGDEVLAESEVVVKDVNLNVDEVTLAQALAALKSTKVQEKEDVIEEPSVPVSTVSASIKDSATTTTPTTTIHVPKPLQDKGKEIMIEEPVVEQMKSIKRLEQIRLDEELAFKLQAEEEEERLAREKAQQKLKKPT